MSNQGLENFLQDCGVYSHLQEKVSQAIRNCDEPTVTALELEARELLNRLESRLVLLVNSAADCKSGQEISPEEIHSLVQCIKESQSQIFANQAALMHWKNELGISSHKRSADVGSGASPEIQGDKSVISAGEPNSPSSTSFSCKVGSSKPIWESRSQQTQIGQKLDRLT